MEHSTQDEGITLGEICHLVGKKILYVLGITVLVTAIAVLLLAFWVNPASARYSLKFAIHYPSSDTLKYPDGTPFDYRELISYSELEKAKETDSRFSKIDVDKMIAEDDISIVADMYTENGVMQFTGFYTITVKGSYFSGKNVAADFIRAVANVPINRAKTLASELNFLLDYNIFEGASYSDRLMLLDDQKEELLAQLDDLIALYSENYTVEGKTLKNYRAQITVLYSDNDGGLRSELQDELDLCGYVPVNRVASRIVELESEHALNEKIIASLKNALLGYPSAAVTFARAAAQTPQEETDENNAQVVISPGKADLSQMLAQFIQRNTQIEYQIAMLSKEENITAFEARLNAEYSKLADAAGMTNSVVNAVYRQESSANFTTSKAIQDGGINLIFGGVAVFVLVFAVACIVVCLKDYPVYKKRIADFDADDIEEEPTSPIEPPEESVLEPAEQTAQTVEQPTKQPTEQLTESEDLPIEQISESAEQPTEQLTEQPTEQLTESEDLPIEQISESTDLPTEQLTESEEQSTE